MKYKAVIVDVDGTILPPTELPADRPSEKLIKAVKEVEDRGIIFTLATGRSLSFLSEVITAFNLKNPIILDNGARIYDPRWKKHLWISYMNKDSAKKVLDILGNEGRFRIIISDDDKRLENPQDIRKWEITKIIALGVTPLDAKRIVARLEAIKDIHLTISVSGVGDKSQSVHITNIEATKQVAIVKLSQMLKIKNEEIIGIGDSYNDFPLLMACGLKVAMGNAVAELKEIADYIAPSYNEDGVVEVLEKFILKNYETSAA